MSLERVDAGASLGLPAYEPPRVPLAHLPTPITATRSWKHVYVKRDDCTGSDLTGNKIRKLEYLIAAAQSMGPHTTLITCGGTQSNHARAAAFAAARCGLPCRLLLRGESVAHAEGNLFLDRLANARIDLVSADDYATRRDEIMHRIAREIDAQHGAHAADDDAHHHHHHQRQHRHALVVEEGGSNVLGCWGYIRALYEIAHQYGGRVPFGTVVAAMGSGGTIAGLVIGRALRGEQKAYDIVGIGVCDSPAVFRAKVEELVAGFESAYGTGKLDVGEWAAVGGFEGPGYAKMYPALAATMRMAASQEGMSLDASYAGKAFHGLASMLADGRIRASEDKPVLFVHTGGLPGLLARCADLEADLLPTSQ